MDKETLSNYGWVVIAVLVLSVMIALATPFGSFIANGIKSTTQGLFDVQQSAIGSVGLTSIPNQSFDDTNAGGGNNSGDNGGNQDQGDPEGTVSGVWLFNETIIIYEDLYQGEEFGGYYIREDINFTSNGQQYRLIGVEWDGANGCFLAYQLPSWETHYPNGPTSCNPFSDCEREWSNWTNEAYRTIDFGSAHIEVSTEFYQWLTLNAQKIG